MWERGCGATLACGTGACACVVASNLLGLCERSVTVNLPGGELCINWPTHDSTIQMTGPYKYVFKGNLDITKI